MTTVTRTTLLTSPVLPGDAAGSTARRPVVPLDWRPLPWAFALFNLARLIAYLPTMWAIQSQHDTSQHSLLTWLSWAGANATMAAWLYEQNQHRCNCAVVLNAANAAMCLATSALIVAFRL